MAGNNVDGVLLIVIVALFVLLIYVLVAPAGGVFSTPRPRRFRTPFRPDIKDGCSSNCTPSWRLIPEETSAKPSEYQAFKIVEDDMAPHAGAIASSRRPVLGSPRIAERQRVSLDQRASESTSSLSIGVDGRSPLSNIRAAGTIRVRRPPGMRSRRKLCARPASSISKSPRVIGAEQNPVARARNNSVGRRPRRQLVG